jgi:type IV pilus assembly protein PilB
LEIGIEPYLVNSSLLGVLAQRLVRTNCPYCLVEETVDASVREELAVKPGEVFYKGKGCEHCHDTGVHGRRAVYELLTVSSRMKALISGHANATDIQAQAVTDGMSQLTDHALQLARQKLISLAEVYRVRLE